MAIPKSNISLREARADVDMGHAGRLKDTYLRHRAKDHDQKEPISMKSLAGTVISMQPYAGKHTGNWTNSPNLGKRYSSYSDLGGTSSQIYGDSCVVATNWTGRYTCDIQITHKKTSGGDILNTWRLFGEIHDPDAQFILSWKNDQVSKCYPQVELHGYRDGPGAGLHRRFGYYQGTQNGDFSLGPYTVGEYKYLMATFPAIHRPQGSGSPITAKVHYSNIKLDLV